VEIGVAGREHGRRDDGRASRQGDGDGYVGTVEELDRFMESVTDEERIRLANGGTVDCDSVLGTNLGGSHRACGWICMIFR